MRTQATTQGARPVPRTQAELRTVADHRDELRAQLEQLSDQRQQLVGERHNASVNQNPAVVAELDARIKTLGERIVRIEQQKLATDDAIAQALAAGVGTSDVPTPVAEPGNFAFNLLNQGLVAQSVAQAEEALRADYQRKMIFGGAGLVLLGVLAWRWMWRRASARLRRELGAAPPNAAAGGTRELKDAVDAIALEVERISENQRFVTKLLSERTADEVVQRPDAGAR